MSTLTSLTELCDVIYAGGDAPEKRQLSKVKTKEFCTPVFSNGIENAGLYGFTSLEPRTSQPAITVSARGTIGHIELRLEPFLPIVRLIVLVPKTEKIDITYLKYSLLNTKIFSSGSSIPQLTVPMIKNLKIIVPPLSEQQRIVSKLDTAFDDIDGLINGASGQISNAKDLYLKIIENLFFSEKKEWNKINLRKACKFSQGVQIPLEKQSIQMNKGYTTRFLRIVDFTQGDEEPRFISDNDVKEILNEHDIAIVRYGASAGFVCTGLKGQIANNLFKVELVTDEFESNYLLCFLKSPIFSNFIANKVSGSAMPALSFSMFNDFEIFYPKSRDEQLNFISNFNLVDRQIKNLISLYDSKLHKLKKLKQIILAQELIREVA